MLSFDSSIQKSADLKTQSSSGSWIERVLLTPYKICKKSATFFYWLKTTNLQLSQKSFKTCLRKLIIIATFIPRNNLLFYLKSKKNQTNKKNRKKKKLDNFFCFLIFRNCPQKSANGDAINIVNAFKVFLKKMKQKRPLKKR